MHVTVTASGRRRVRLGLVFVPAALLALFVLSSVVDGTGALSALTTVRGQGRSVGALVSSRPLSEPSEGQT